MNARTALLILGLTPAIWPADSPSAHFAASAQGQASPAEGTMHFANAMTASKPVSMDQAVKMVERRFNARVVKAETERDNGRMVYVLRLLSDSGRVWTVRVDAADGVVQ
jgi:uncharacterized membrane protein YkoI